MNDAEDSEFKRLFGDVKSIKNDRVNLLPDRQKQKKTGSRSTIAAEDPREPDQARLSGSFSDSYFNPGIQNKLQSRIRAGTFQIEARLDLHGLRSDQASKALHRFIKQSLQQQYRMILVVHGQGYGSRQQAVLKPMVFRQIAEYPEVLAWCPAQPRDGAGGATYVYLKRK